jgi:hypothetical protein
MTSSVLIKACCAEGLEVFISVTNRGIGASYTLQNGEDREVTIYDAVVVKVSERVRVDRPEITPDRDGTTFSDAA